MDQSVSVEAIQDARGPETETESKTIAAVAMVVWWSAARDYVTAIDAGEAKLDAPSPDG
jgi:hypothetical protein